ncbi:aldehyde dehydrogenase family protein [Patescibacteria group bacterium]|nr:aldehyde dehydrogenase family protein [Patescibacteria group bacterium]
MNKLVSTNPYQKFQLNGEVEITPDRDIMENVIKAKNSFKTWSNLTVLERISYLQKIYDVFENNKKSLSKIIGQEIGMPVSIRESMEIGTGLEYFKWYLENSDKYLASEITFEDDTNISKVYYEPIGVAAVVVPWNFPFCNFIWGVIPNLIAGNTVVFKHSEECPLTGKLLEDLISKCNLPDGVFNEIYGDGETGDVLVNQDIDLVSFTGSTRVGQHLYKLASDKFIKANLELGGSAPGIVFEDADIDKVIETIYFARFYNSGQVCDGLKRLIVHHSKYEVILDKLKNVLQSKKIGNPELTDVDMGPLVSEKQYILLDNQVRDSINEGADVYFEGVVDPTLKGAYYPSQILTNIKVDMRVWQEEVFGPVLPVISFNTFEEAIGLANDTKYGLGGYIFTEDKDLALNTASKIQSGMLSVNNSSYLNPSNPWVGRKKSGIGVGNAQYGLRELTSVKLITTEK